MKISISTNTDFEQLIISSLEQAQKSIDIVCFEVSSPSIINTLRSCVNRKLTVNIFCERRKASDELISWSDNLAQQNDSLSQYSTICFSVPNEIYYALHEKLIFIDNKKVLFGSFNLSDNSLKHSIEILIETSDPKIIEATRKQFTFLKNLGGPCFSCVCETTNWLSQTSNHEFNINIGKYESNTFDPLSRIIHKDGSNKLVFSHEMGSVNESDMFRVIVNALQSAQSEILIYASHRIGDEVIEEIKKAIKRGVYVQIIKDQSAIQLEDIKKPLREITRYVQVDGKMHVKAILIDSKKYLIGSVNLFPRSLFQDQEVILTGNDPFIYNQIQIACEIINSRSEPLSQKKLLKIQFKHFLFGIIIIIRRILKKSGFV